jgi:iron(III) transport system ATP-binding protein
MSGLLVTGARKSFGPVTALDGVDLAVRPGSLMAVLGPSGCGKSTLLRCVAGFERLDGGEILVAGRPVARTGLSVPPERRRIAIVPQDGALFPHMSVAGNVAYGLDRGARRSGRVAETLALVGLAGYEDRMPHQLSGGQQQRVAVARALAPRPPLVLLDEPFSALDAALRGELRRDVRAALRADGATAVLVTHDQGEALSIADEIAVMRAGRIVQNGLPADVYRAPADPWVAGFLGEAVLLAAERDGDRAHTPLGAFPVAANHGAVTVFFRPEQIQVLPAGTPDGVPATVLRRDFHGHDALLQLRLDGGQRISARVFDPAQTVLAIGDAVAVRVRGDAVVYPSASAAGA